MMTHSKPLNIIVAGLGGQGVFTLTKILWILCDIGNIKCQSSTFKGGAQKHGSIHSVLRLFQGDQPDHALYSSQIPKGDLDVIIGFEPWETLRYHAFFGRNTRIFTNTRCVPFLVEQSGAIPSDDPVQRLKDMPLEATARDYSALSMDQFGTGKMVNFLMGLDVAASSGLPFDRKDFTDAFIRITRPDRELERKCRLV
jgi:indolepyruvate ferredoxin oxidoreductase beta subunit